MNFLKRFLSDTILLVIILSEVLTFKCPPVSRDFGKAIAVGNNYVFNQIAKCSYQFVQDISTNQSTLYSGFNSANFKTKLQLYNGKLFGSWAYTSYYNSIWWCDKSNLLMATYIGISGSGIEYLWRLFLNQHQSSSSSSSLNEGSVCGGIDIVFGNAKLSSEFIDGVIVFLLPNDSSRPPIVKEVSVNFFPHANTLQDSIKVFDYSKKDILNRKMKEFIKSSIALNLLPAIEISLRKGINKCLPLVKKLMSEFNGRTSIDTQTPPHANRIQSVISKLRHSPKTPKRSANNQLNELHEMRTIAVSKLIDKYYKCEERAQFLLSELTPFPKPKPKI